MAWMVTVAGSMKAPSGIETYPQKATDMSDRTAEIRERLEERLGLIDAGTCNFTTHKNDRQLMADALTRLEEAERMIEKIAERGYIGHANPKEVIVNFADEAVDIARRFLEGG